jgi:hypothetical protein
MERSVRNLGGPVGSSEELVGLSNRKGGGPMAGRDSDQPIVL